MSLINSVPRPKLPKPIEVPKEATGGVTAAPPEPQLALQEMAKEALVFLDDPMARKLAVAWPLTGGDEDEWFDVAGINPSDRAMAVRLCMALQRNGICRAGGVTDATALNYIRVLVTEPLLKGNRRGKK